MADKWKKMAKALGAKITGDSEVTVDIIDKAGEPDDDKASISENASKRKSNLKKGYPYRDPNMEVSDSLPEVVRKVMKRTPMIAAADEKGNLKDNYIRVGSKRLRKIDAAISKTIHGNSEIVEEDKGVDHLQGEGVTDRIQQRNELARQGESGRK